EDEVPSPWMLSDKPRMRTELLHHHGLHLCPRLAIGNCTSHRGNLIVPPDLTAKPGAGFAAGSVAGVRVGVGGGTIKVNIQFRTLSLSIAMASSTRS
ncbi:hypothetical protein Tco_1412977, partial [Tanacetum coccineum]